MTDESTQPSLAMQPIPLCLYPVRLEGKHPTPAAGISVPALQSLSQNPFGRSLPPAMCLSGRTAVCPYAFDGLLRYTLQPYNRYPT